MDLYDIHNHLIFGVDDGSRSLDESVTMIKQYIESGYAGAIVTSHYDKGRYLVTADKVMAGLEEIKGELHRQDIEFDLYPGNEIQIDLDTIKDIESGKILRLNNSRYVLCELPMMTKPHYAESVFYEMQLNGWVPIIAHPERYSYVQEDPDWLLQFVKKGCLIQMNLSSLFKPDSKEVAKELLERDMVSIVATDSHQSEWRSPEVCDELDELRILLGGEKYFELASVNPRKVIENKPIAFNSANVKPREVKKEKKKWYKFWR